MGDPKRYMQLLLCSFEYATGYVEQIHVTQEEAALLLRYREALEAQRFEEAVDCLLALGEFQQCPTGFWNEMRDIVQSVWRPFQQRHPRGCADFERRLAVIRQRGIGEL
jgi:hypothetical protein